MGLSCAASTVPLPPLSTIMKIARLSDSEHCTWWGGRVGGRGWGWGWGGSKPSLTLTLTLTLGTAPPLRPRVR